MSHFNSEEAFDLFWSEYDKRLTGGSTSAKGVKKKALQAWKRKITSAKKSGYVLARFRLQRDEFLRKTGLGEFQANFPHVSRYISQERWEIEVEAGSGVNGSTQVELKKCAYVGCNNDVKGLAFTECDQHLNATKNKSELISFLKENDLMKKKGESDKEWRGRLVEYNKSKIGIINSRVNQI